MSPSKSSKACPLRRLIEAIDPQLLGECGRMGFGYVLYPLIAAGSHLDLIRAALEEYDADDRIQELINTLRFHERIRTHGGDGPPAIALHDLLTGRARGFLAEIFDEEDEQFRRDQHGY